MNTTISITTLRKNLFEISEKLEREGGEVVVEKDGKPIFKVTPVENTAKARAERLLKLADELAGTWKDEPDDDFFRGKKEIEYMKNLGNDL